MDEFASTAAEGVVEAASTEAQGDSKTTATTAEGVEEVASTTVEGVDKSGLRRPSVWLGSPPRQFEGEATSVTVEGVTTFASHAGRG